MTGQDWAALAASISAAVSAVAAFFAYLVASTERERWQIDRMDRRAATISLALNTQARPALIIRNEGPASLTALRISALPDEKGFIDLDMVKGVWPLDLHPGQRFQLPVVLSAPYPRYAVLRLHAEWHDGNGQRSHIFPVTVAIGG